jgi:hypothetical protein
MIKLGIIICDRYRTCTGGKCLDMHTRLGTWVDPAWQPFLEPVMTDEATRKAYN